MMPHVDPDRLAQLALGDPGDDGPGDTGGPGGTGGTGDAGITAHLDSCADCRAELDGMRDTVSRIRGSSIRPSDIDQPPERVWRAIAAELADPASASPSPSPAPVVVPMPAPAHRRPWVLAAVAAVAALAGVAGTLAVTRLVDDSPPPIEDVALSPLTGGPQDVAGNASVTVTDDATELEVSTRGLDDPQPGFYEVWVTDPDDLSRMYSIGALGTDAVGRFTVPPNVDLDRFSVIDVSIEPDDGDPTHSTNSVLRGALPPA
jgi:anti-sigma-K factor RskA